MSNANHDLCFRVERDIYTRLVNCCIYNDGSINDLMTSYDTNKQMYMRSALRDSYDDRKSRLLVKAFNLTLRQYGYQRNSLP